MKHSPPRVALLLTALIAPACAGPSPASPSVRLLQGLVAGGAREARMFIAIDLDALPEAAVDRPERQRSEIAGWQSRILSQLDGHYDPARMTRYRTLPAVVLDLDATGLALLAALVREHGAETSLPDLRVGRDPLMRPHRMAPAPLAKAFALTGSRGLPPELDGRGQVLVIIDDGVSEGFDVTANRVVAGGFITSGEPRPCHSSTQNVKKCFEDKSDGYPVFPPEFPNHGTQLAAIACGSLGVAPVARCFSIRVADSTGTILFSDVVEALEEFYLHWTAVYPQATINLSLGLAQKPSPDVASCESAVWGPATKLACQNLLSKGCPIVASAGNDGCPNAISFPACLEQVVAVGATTKRLVDCIVERSPFSNWGPLVDVAAPGTNLVVPTNGYVFGFGAGTSVAAPQVAGLLMLLRQASPSCPVEELMRAVATSDVQSGPDPSCVPFLDASTALEAALAACPPDS